LINLNDIKGHSALSLLENYAGINPYLKKMRNDYLKNKKIQLTETQVKYIIENHQREPMLINRVVNISKFLGEELQRQEELSFIPERVLIEYILAENEKSYHIYGKLKKNQVDSKMYWLPKTQVLDDPYFEELNVDVNFEKYNNILKKYDKKLYEHQERGIKFLLSRNGNILADDMGLGKSIQSIIAALESGAKNILVVCPSSVKINWKREIEVFCDDVAIVEGRKWLKAKFTIINYDILKNFHTLGDGKKKNITDPTLEFNRHLVNAHFDLVIIDEAHYLKNNKSIRGEIMVDLIVNNNIERAWLLTGTPIANRPMDFYNLLKIIKAPIANNWQYFATRYCDARKMFRTLKNGQKKQIWLTDGASNLDELAAKTKNLILRRLKEDVLDMPDKVISPVYHELTNKGWDEYDRLWDDYLEKRKAEKKRGSIQRDLVELILLRKFIAMEAIPQTIEMVENMLETGKKVIIFTSFTDELNELAEYFGKRCVTHNGPMNDREKQKSVDSFQNNANVRVFIGNIKSAGVGITLTEANFVVFNSFDWVPGSNEQAEDRAYRIGQKNNVNVYYQLFENTVSTRMWEVLRNKKDIISTIIGDKKLTEEEIIEIMTDKLIDENYG
jgi:SWI/SNF-related matrix-associated actin-dependent regulator 1 of chromatin subfamily A